MAFRKLVIATSAIAGAGLLAVSPAIAQTPQKPNIILIVSDDTGYGDLGPYGGLSQYERFQYIRDALAKDGISIHLPTGN